MATSQPSPNYTSKSLETPPASASFDEFAKSRASIEADATRSSSGKATSFEFPSNTTIIEFLKKTAEPITNKFMLAPPSASTINIRRLSTQNAFQIEPLTSKNGDNSPATATTTAIQSTLTKQNNFDGSVNDDETNASPKQPIANETDPPPVPRRTFLGKIMTPRSSTESPAPSPSATIKTTFNIMCKQTIEEVKRRNVSAKQMPQTQQTMQTTRRLVENHYPIDQYSDDDRFSIESSVFEDPKSSDPLMFAASSNRSSSDSNKSHTTIDTGYMSASNDTDRIFFGASEDFRSRFSSVDTQSSIDSCTSADMTTQQGFTSLQNQARCILSPLVAKRDEYEEKFTAQIHKSFSRMNSASSILSSQTKHNNVVNNHPKIPNNMANGRAGVSQSTRVIPSSSSARGSQQSLSNRPNPQQTSSVNTTQNSLDSGRILYNGSMLGAFQSGLAKLTSAAATTSEVVMGRRSFKQTNATPHVKLSQRQDSSISSDSFSMTSSPGYNTKNMETPLLQHAAKIHKTSCLNGNNNVRIVGRDMPTAVSTNGKTVNNTMSRRTTVRQDSSLSSDSFSTSAVSSTGYINKLQEQPLLANSSKLHVAKQHLKCVDEISRENLNNGINSAITKSASTPASLQTVVRFQNGSNMSLQNKIMNRRKSSNPYITRGRLKFRLLQILLNALALLIIAGGLAAYFRAYPTVKFINKTIIAPQKIQSIETTIAEKPKIESTIAIIDKNPAPGICLPIIVKFCQNQHIPYNYTVYPNYIGHFSQLEAEEDLEAYDALVDVKCYELASLFLCSLFVPKCGKNGLIPPCKSLCLETMRRCGFFLGVFNLELPDYLSCNQFTDSPNPDICVGHKEIRDAYNRAMKPACSGFLCDKKRCIPNDWRCDGHVDCLDQTDESKCDTCGPDSIYCGENKCMSSKHVCDGEINCPYGQDERNCIRLSERNGDLGKGVLEIYKVQVKKWVPACVRNWAPATSPSHVCSMLGYSSVNSSRVTILDTNMTISPSSFVPKDETAIWRMYQRKKTNLIKEFSSCPNEKHAVVDLTCTNYECGKVRNRRYRAKTRIVGGSESSPGDWPFLAAILGGPEEIFYCAGVLIADQWVLTASHCIGNLSLHNINSWTIQLGITRRHSHTYYGQKVKVQRVIPHPQYNLEIIHDNDIALFQLATRVAFHEHLLPVCLPPPDLVLDSGTMCTVIGWGKKEDKKPSASYEPTVNEVKVPILHRDICNDWLVQLNVTDGMICAGYSEGGKDACQGDSGGPLLCRDSNDRERYFVAGIVSWGVKCANPKLPGVYANVPKYIPWILQNMQNYSNIPIDYSHINFNNRNHRG